MRTLTAEPRRAGATVTALACVLSITLLQLHLTDTLAKHRNSKSSVARCSRLACNVFDEMLERRQRAFVLKMDTFFIILSWVVTI
ncbi:unnamed protein product [Urochloa humidicola]